MRCSGICQSENPDAMVYPVTCEGNSGGHSFHLQCIIPWVSVKPDCPLCKKTVLTIGGKPLQSFLRPPLTPRPSPTPPPLINQRRRLSRVSVTIIKESDPSPDYRVLAKALLGAAFCYQLFSRISHLRGY